MDKGAAVRDVDLQLAEGLDCGARSLACFSYEDPNTYERVGGRLFAQALCCPATVLGANASLLDGEGPSPEGESVPCSGGLGIGPKGAELYSSTCRSQLLCGLACLGLPVLYTDNLIQRQLIRQKYGFPPLSSCSEMAASCCYPCSLVQAHTLLREDHVQEANRLQRAGTNDTCGPLEMALRAMHRTAADAARNAAATAGQQNAGCPSSATPDDMDAYTKVSILNPATAKGVDSGSQTRQQTDVVADDTHALHESLSFTATALPSISETPDKIVTLFGRERAPTRQVPAASSSSDESRSTAGSSSVPPAEFTDSPRVGASAAAPTGSFAASSGSNRTSLHDDADSNLTDSASFQVPSALPLASMVRDPPTFVVPSTLKPPDSMDSEIVAAWMQGPKLTHLSQSLQRPHVMEASRNGTPTHASAAPAASSRPRQVTTSAMSGGSEASLFSIALEPPSMHASPMAHQNFSASGSAPYPRMATSAVVDPSTTGPPNGGHTPGSSRDIQHCSGYDTITSSKLSCMIDNAMLSGSGGSGSGGASTAALTPADSAVFRDSNYRHSVMAPIAEVEIEEATTPSQSASGLASPSSRPLGGAAGSMAASKDAANSVASSAVQRAGTASVASSRNAQRGQRASGLGSAGTWQGSSRAGLAASGGRGSGGGAAGRGSGVGGAGGATLTALVRMDSDCGSSSGGGGTRASNGNRSGAGPGRQRLPTSSLALPAPSSYNAAALARAAGTNAVGRPILDRRASTEDGVDASADNFSGVVFAAVAAQFQHHAAYPSCAFGDSDDVNMGTLRSSFIDAPDMAHFRQLLRVAGNGVDAEQVAAPSAAGAAAAPTSSSASFAPVATSRSASRSAIVAVGALPNLHATSGSRRYGGAPATTLGAAAAAVPTHSAMYASYCGDGPSHDTADAESALDEEDPNAIDGPVSSAAASSSAASRDTTAAAGATAMSTRRRSSASHASGSKGSRGSAGGDASVSVAVTRPGLGGGPEPAASAAFSSASALSASKRSASGLSNGDTNGGAYDSTADSIGVSQHRQKHWINWMAQSVMSMGMSDAGSSRLMRSGLGRPSATATAAGGAGGGARGSRAAVAMGGGADPASSCNSMSVNQRPLAVAEEEDDGSSAASGVGGRVYRRWG